MNILQRIGAWWKRINQMPTCHICGERAAVVVAWPDNQTPLCGKHLVEIVRASDKLNSSNCG